MNQGQILKSLICAAVMIASSMPMRGETAVTIVEHITAVDGNIVEQPSKLADLLKPSSAPVADTPSDKERTTPVNGRMAGYRVQVFSDSNQRTAKSETQRKAAAVVRKFPAMRTYSSYSAPYWRLRVGDFRTRKEAEEAASALKSAFPAYKNEIRVVRDRINARD